MLEEQPLDLTVRGAEPGPAEPQSASRKPSRCAVAEEADEPDPYERTCSEDSDDSSDAPVRKRLQARCRPPGTKPYKKNLIKRYRKCTIFLCYFIVIVIVKFVSDRIVCLLVPEWSEAQNPF